MATQAPPNLTSPLDDNDGFGDFGDFQETPNDGDGDEAWGDFEDSTEPTTAASAPPE